MRHFCICVFVCCCLYPSGASPQMVPDSVLHRKYDYHMHHISQRGRENTDSIYMGVFGEVRYYNAEALYEKYVTRGFRESLDDLLYYYHDIVHHMPVEDAGREAAKMRQAARRYKSRELENEAELMTAMYLPHRNREEVDIKVAELQRVADRSARIGDFTTRLRAMRIILEEYWSDPSGPRYAESFKQARLISNILEELSEEEYPLKRNDYFMLAEPYYRFRDYDRAVPYLEKALTDTTRTFFDRSNMQARNILGSYYRYMDDLDMSDYYFLSMLQSADMVKYRPMYDAMAFGNLAQNNVLRGQPDEAIRLYYAALPISIGQRDFSFTAGISLGLGECYLMKGELEKVRPMADTALVYMHQPHISYNRHHYPALYSLLSKYHSAKGNPELSRMYMDSVAMAKKEMDKKFNSLVILRGEQELFEAEKQVRDEELLRKRRQLALSFGLGMAVLIALLVTAWYYRQTKRSYRALAVKAKQWANVDSLEVQGGGAPANNDDDDDDTPSGTGAAEKTYEEEKMLADQVHELMMNDHTYRDNTLTLDSLAAMMRITRGSLSHAINRVTGKNFNSFINEYRVKESVRIMSDGRQKNIYIDELYELVGFNSRASFYRAFKQITGLSPTEFKRNEDSR